MGVDNTLEIDINVLPEDASCTAMEWYVEDSSVAGGSIKYQKKCTILGKTIGTTTLVATSLDGDHIAACMIRVVSNRVTGINMPNAEKDVPLGLGRSLKLQANTIPSNADNTNILWSSSDDSIVTVDEEGNITGNELGTATITALTEDGRFSASCTVSTYIPVSEIVLSENSLALTKGMTVKVYASISPSDADSNHKKLTWSASSGYIVQLTPNTKNLDNQYCEIYARYGGNTRITVSTDDGYIKEYIDVTITVPVTSLRFSFDSVNMHIGDKKRVLPTINPYDATNKNIHWSSSNEEVAIVDENGEVTALSLGETRITAVAEDGGYSDSYTVYVIIPVTGIELNENSVTVFENETKQLSATVFPDDAGDKSLSWRSSDTNTARVDSNGLVTAVKAGTATITATTKDGGFSADCIVSVEHKWNDEYTVDLEATCTEVGSESIHCSVCDAINEETIREIPKKEHAYGEWTMIQAPTCTETGSRERSCADCGDIATETIPANGHSWNEEYTIDLAATCTKEGSESIHCSVCDVINEDTIREIPKTEHVYGEWSITKPATCTETGSRKKICSKCGDTVTETIPASGHQWNNDYTIDNPATCTQEGSESVHCSICGAINEESIQAIPKIDHNYGEWTVTKEPSCTEEGSKEKACTACGEKVTEPIPANGHRWNNGYIIDKPSTCTEEGSKSIHCSVCDEIDETTIQVIPKREHTYGSWTVTAEPSCTEEGSKEKACTACGNKIIETIPANGHTWNEEYTVDKEPTYIEDGSKSIHCSICDAIKEGSAIVIPRLTKDLSELTVTGITNKTYTGKAITQNVLIKDGDKVLVKDEDYTISYENNINVGMATVTITGTGSYSGTVSLNFYILPGASKKVTCTNLADCMKVEWEKVPGATQYKVYRDNELIKTTSGLVIGDKDVKYEVGEKFTYKVVATNDIVGDSTVSRTGTYYRLLPVGVKTLTSPSAGKLTVTYGKCEGCYGYVVRYGKNSDMSDSKTLAVKGENTLTKTISVEKGKTYYVQVRTYMLVDGVRYFSTYSRIKSVKVK